MFILFILSVSNILKTDLIKFQY